MQIYRVELPGHMLVGEGKPENQVFCAKKDGFCAKTHGFVLKSHGF